MPKQFIAKLSLGVVLIMIAGCASAKGTDTTAKKGGGLTTRAYVADEPRVDQEMQGNFGYLQGTPVPQDRSNLKKTRKIYVLELTKEVPEQISETTVAAAPETSAVVTESEMESPRPVAPRRQPIVIPRIDDEPVAEEREARTSTEPVTEQEYTIQKNDTLQKISKKFYGSYSKWPKIYDVNKDVIKNPNRVKEGTVIKIPSLE